MRCTGETQDGSKHRLAGGWVASIHDAPARCSSNFVPLEHRLLRTDELKGYTPVYRADGSRTLIERIGMLDAVSHSALHDDADLDRVTFAEDGTATLCRDDDLWLVARGEKAPGFLPWITTSMADIERLDHAGFEHLVADFLHLAGCCIVQETGKTNDKGADVIATTPSGRRLVVQCKRWKSRVGFNDLAKVGGTARQLHGADDVWVVALRDFTESARDYAAKANITLITGADLEEWLAGSPPGGFAG